MWEEKAGSVEITTINNAIKGNIENIVKKLKLAAKYGVSSLKK